MQQAVLAARQQLLWTAVEVMDLWHPSITLDTLAGPWPWWGTAGPAYRSCSLGAFIPSTSPTPPACMLGFLSSSPQPTTNLQTPHVLSAQGAFLPCSIPHAHPSGGVCPCLALWPWPPASISPRAASLSPPWAAQVSGHQRGAAHHLTPSS